MTMRTKFWLAGAVLFSGGNFAGGVFAAAQGELRHAGVHAVLMLLGVYVAWRLVLGSSGGGPRGPGGSALPAPPDDLTDRLAHLEQSVDAVAIEVERIGEGQRFVTRLFTEDRGSPKSEQGAAEPIDIKKS